MIDRYAFFSAACASTLLAALSCATSNSPKTALSGRSAATHVKSAPVHVAAIRNVGKHKGDFLPAHNWKIEIDGVLTGGFKEMSLNLNGKAASGFKEIVGLESEIEFVEFKDGDPSTHKRAGKAKYKNIVLENGFIANDGMPDWFGKVPAGTTDRKSGSIIYLDRAGQEVLRYNFFKAWPSVRNDAGVVMDRDAGIVVAQQVELMVEGFERETFKAALARP
jgi:phage tail-like protein